MFSFWGMVDNYEDRKVARYEDGVLSISTARVTDSEQPYETAIEHPAYNDGCWVIVAVYDSIENAQSGHDNWVKKMTSEQLPDQLRDVSTAETAVFADIFSNDWRTFRRE